MPFIRFIHPFGAMVVAALSLGSGLALAGAAPDEPTSFAKRTDIPARLLVRPNGQDGFREVPAESTDARIVANGSIARTELIQTFRAGPTSDGRLFYSLSIPGGVELDDLLIRMHDRAVETKVAPRQPGSPLDRTGRNDHLLIELPAMSNEEPISVTLRYGQALAFDKGKYVLQVPKWSEGGERVAVSVDAGLPLAQVDSPTHQVKVVADGQGAAYVTMGEPIESARASEGFRLSWQPDAGRSPRFAVFKERHDGASHVLLTLLPPTDPRESASRLERDLAVLIDASTRMPSAALRAAQQTVLAALSQLGTGDRFQIYAPGFQRERFADDWSEASGARRQEAAAYLNEIGSAQGSVRTAAFTRPPPSGDPRRLQQMVMIASLERFAQWRAEIEQAASEHPLFLMLIGQDPPRTILARIAQIGRGEVSAAENIADFSAGLQDMFRRLGNPILTDISVHWPAGLGKPASPQPTADLYADRPVSLLARIDGDIPPDAKVEVSGRLHGRLWRGAVPLDHGREAQGVAKFWAAQRIAAEAAPSSGDETAQAEKQEIALRYNLISRYTKLVGAGSEVVGEAPPAEDVMVYGSGGMTGLRLQDMPVAGGRGSQFMLLGLLSLMAAGALFLMARRFR